jgi:hypothetical protein
MGLGIIGWEQEALGKEYEDDDKHACYKRTQR